MRHWKQFGIDGCVVAWLRDARELCEMESTAVLLAKPVPTRHAGDEISDYNRSKTLAQQQRKAANSSGRDKDDVRGVKRRHRYQSLPRPQDGRIQESIHDACSAFLLTDSCRGTETAGLHVARSLPRLVEAGIQADDATPPRRMTGSSRRQRYITSVYVSDYDPVSAYVNAVRAQSQSYYSSGGCKSSDDSNSFDSAYDSPVRAQSPADAPSYPLTCSCCVARHRPEFKGCLV